jgi:hypothetical protein
MRRNRVPFIAAAALLMISTGLLSDEKVKPIETFSAVGVKMGPGSSSHITIAIERWTTDQEREALLGILRDKGQQELVEALFKLPRVGYIRLPNTMARDLKYARSIQNPDGSRTVVVSADRPLQFVEVVGSSRSQKYNFGFAEMKFPAGGGKGEGKLAPASMIVIDKDSGQIEIEHYSAQPVRLMNVTSKQPG